MASLIVLVHAPVLGPATWQPVATALSRAGHQVVVPSLTGFADDGPPYAPRLIRMAASQMPAGPGDEVILVVHSGAGLFVPNLAVAAAAGSVAAVFVDAGLPRQSGPVTVVEPEFLPFVRELADARSDGMVPPWPQWWPEEEISALFPDQPTRQAVIAEACPTPLAFYQETLPPLAEGWPSCGAAYLVFSEPYRRQADVAAQAGWPVRELPGGHLHMLVRPAEVAGAITSLAARARAAGPALSSLPAAPG